MWLVVLTLGATVLVTAGVFGGDHRTCRQEDPFRSGPHETLLSVMSAGSGTLEPQGNSSTTYTLTLQALDRNVVWFTDHPDRKTGTLPATGFVQDWAGYGISADPPNTALVLDSVHPGRDTAVGALSSVRFDPAADRIQATFTVYRGQQLRAAT